MKMYIFMQYDIDKYTRNKSFFVASEDKYDAINALYDQLYRYEGSSKTVVTHELTEPGAYSENPMLSVVYRDILLNVDHFEMIDTGNIEKNDVWEA